MRKIACSIVLIIFTAMLAFAQKYSVNTDTRSIVLNYPDSTLKFEILNTDKSIKFDDNLVYYWYSTDKINTNRGGIGGKPLHGIYYVSSKSGSLLVQGKFDLGLKDGIWKYWYINGELKKVETWKNGKLNGSQINYSRSGKIETELQFKNGKEIVLEEKEPFLKRVYKKKEKEKVEEVTVQPVKTEPGDKN